MTALQKRCTCCLVSAFLRATTAESFSSAFLITSSCTVAIALLTLQEICKCLRITANPLLVAWDSPLLLSEQASIHADHNCKSSFSLTRRPSSPFALRRCMVTRQNCLHLRRDSSRTAVMGTDGWTPLSLEEPSNSTLATAIILRRSRSSSHAGLLGVDRARVNSLASVLTSRYGFSSGLLFTPPSDDALRSTRELIRLRAGSIRQHDAFIDRKYLKR